MGHNGSASPRDVGITLDEESEWLADFVDDQLTQLACLRQGIQSEELLPIISVGGDVEDTVHGQLRFEHLDARRRAKLRVVKEERLTLVSRCARVCRGEVTDPKLDSEILFFCAKVCNVEQRDLTEAMVDALGPFARPSERDVVRTVGKRALATLQDHLCLAEPVHDASSMKAAKREAEMYRERELRQVHKEKMLEETSDALREATRARELRCQEVQHRKLEAIRQRGREKQRELRQKLCDIQSSNEQRDLAVKEDLAARLGRREEKEAQQLQEKEQERQMMCLQHQHRFDLVKERQRLATCVQGQKQDLQREDLECKLQLHEQRSINESLNRAAQKERNRVRRLHHVINITKVRHDKEMKKETQSLSIFKKDEAAESRLAVLQAKTRRGIAEKKRRTAAMAALADANRSQLELQRVHRVNAILKNTLQKEQHVQSTQLAQAFMRGARDELRYEQKLCMEDNRRRLQRMRDYRHAVALTKVQEATDREKAHKMQVAKKQSDSEAALRETRRMKEQIREEIRNRGKQPQGQIARAPQQQRKILEPSAPASVASDDTAQPTPDTEISPVMQLLQAVAAPPAIEYTDETSAYLSGERGWDPAIVFPSYCGRQSRRLIHSAPVQGRIAVT